ncbi:hypothetical protein Trydic_g6590 [Trypoxylus dichotomus]
MASAHTDYKTIIIGQLCQIFTSFERDVIQSVLESCNFNIELAQRKLYEMTTENPQSMSKPPMYYTPYNSASQNPFPQQYSHLLAFIRKGYKVLILMRGLPGSGKSTLAITIIQHGLGQVFYDEFIFSTDDYFCKSGQYVYNPSQIEDAHAWNQRRCFANMRKGVSPIIIDNTNLQTWEMKVYCVMAVKFGYIVDIVEAQTPWALNTATLSIKNSHGVDKKKISGMKERYQRNITIHDVFKEFKLSYTVDLPQFRKYPPIMEPSPKPVDVVDKLKKKEVKIPIEYVHKFKAKHEDPPNDKKKSVSVDQLLDIGSECKQKQPKNDDLISFINEHKMAMQIEDPLLPMSNSIEQVSKQLEENNMIMSQPVQSLSNTKVGENSITMCESKMEVDQSSSSQDENEIDGVTENKMRDLRGSRARQLADLEEENKELQKQLDKTLKSDKTKTNKAFSLLTKTMDEKADTKQLQAARLEMYYKRVKAAKSGGCSSSDFEIVDDTDLALSPTAITTGSSKSGKSGRSSIPKCDLKAWGLPEDALVSWDTMTAPVYEFKSPNTSATYVETCEQATNTTGDDLKSIRDVSNGSNVVITPLERKNLSMKERIKEATCGPPKKVMLDKGCMTEEEEALLRLEVSEAERIRKLMEMFPDISIDNLLDIYEKCQKDFHWTVDLLSGTPMACPPSIGVDPNQNKEKNQDVAGPALSPPVTSFNFDLNDWNLIPDKLETTKEIEKESAKKKEEEEEIKQQQKKQEVLELKKQLEKTVTIGKEHYSDHVWQLKTAKMGRPAVEPDEPKPGPSDLFSLDADMIYISDDSSECSSDNDDEDENIDEDIVELTLGNELVNQLEEMFGHLTPGDNFKPVVQVPESLARQLHAFYLESICRQIENQSDYISSRMKEDEDFAVKLQEAERIAAGGNSMKEIMDEELAMNLYKKDVDQWKNLSPDTLALKLTRQKLYAAFPTIEQKILDEILVAHDNNYMQTIQAIMNSTDKAPVASTSGGDLMEPPISDTTLNEMKIHSKFINKVTDEADGAVKSALEYREEANGYMQKYKELRTLTQTHYNGRNYAVSLFYSDLAQKQLKKAELANQHAARCFIRENSEKLQKSDMLDLHFQYADSALTSLDIFIDCQISNLRSKNKPFGHYFVITGWGKRSKNGKPVLKPVVIRRLRQRKVHYTVVNPGMLRIKVLKNLAMSTDIKSKMSK